jgi:hypothetical protein
MRGMGRLLAVALVIGVGGCGIEQTLPPSIDAPNIPDAPPGAWLAGFMYRKPIVVMRATGTSTLVNFPVGIILDGDPDLVAHARGDGGDIVVTSGDAMTRLDSELATYAGASGALEIWTRVPMLPPGQTILYIYYGGDAAATNAAGVWPANLFKGVWHLGESGGTSRDSTSAAHHLGSTGTSIPTNADGRAGRARLHDGLDDTLAVLDPVDGSLDVGMNSFAFSTWIYSMGTVNMFDNPFFRGGTSPGSPGYCFLTGNYVPPEGAAWLGKLHDGANYVELGLTPTATTMQWLHLVVVVDRAPSPDTATAYVNGAVTDTRTITLGSLDTTRELSVGSALGASAYHGITDELRIYNMAPTAEWIATEHANLATAGFITKGTEQRSP